MGQPVPPQWWEVIVGILAIPATAIGLIYSWILIQKTTLEAQKIKLEILEIENKLRATKEPSSNLLLFPNKVLKDSKSKSALQKFLLDIRDSENRITNFLMILLRPFKIIQQEKSNISISGQRIVGSVVELFFLFLFLYADISINAQNLIILFPATIPSFLPNTNMPLLIGSVGTPVVLGVMIGDLTGLTNLTSWADLRKRKKAKTFLSIMLVTLVTNVLLSSYLVVYRLNLLVNIPQSIVLLASLAQSLIILPMLITTALLFNGTQGFLVLLALPLISLRLLLTILRKFIAKMIYYFS